ncbi:MAG TPA: A/G-specific adenine glycosylase [Bacteroidota bacterium]|nr:A/G-specific adenine glycosylase [Bacteroidota bacterium]
MNLKPNPMMDQKANIKKFHSLLLHWYNVNQRPLPWRDTNNPYVILISEIMLQQTQVSRVREKLPLFLKKFPTLQKLAKSSKAEVIRAWQGMGYNNRAVRLHQMSKNIIKNYDGRIPSEASILKELPGIGDYTSSAVACFAFYKRVPVVDVNIRRVLSRIFWKMKSPSDMRKEEEIWRLAKKILPNNCSRWHHALMDLGATICTSRKPFCTQCPVIELCKSKFLHRHANREKSRQKSFEPTYAGLQRRLWRGKIIEALRNVNGTGLIPIMRLGRTVKPDFSKKEIHWLKIIINQLCDDGLLQILETPRTMKVRLAQE